MRKRTSRSGASERRSFLVRGSSLAAGFALGASRWALADEIKPTKKAAAKVDAKPPAPVGCAVIGLGEQGRALLSALGQVPGADVRLVCDSYEGTHKRALEAAPKAKAVNDHRRVLEDAAVQVVFVATPTHLHKDVALAALAAGKHVYCEAPLAGTVDEARAIARAAAASKQVLLPGLQRRANPIDNSVFGFVKTRALGPLVGARGHFHKKTSWRRAAATPDREAALNWRLSQKTSSGLLGEVGIHQLDLACWYLAARPLTVMGAGAVLAWKDGRDVADSVQCLVEFPGGLRYSYEATLGSSYDGTADVYLGTNASTLSRDARAWMFKEADAPALGWEVYATKEKVAEDTGIALVANASKLLDEGKDPSESAHEYVKGALYYACENLLECARGRGKPACTPAQGFEATVVALKANEAIGSGNKITFKPEWFAI